MKKGHRWTTSKRDHKKEKLSMKTAPIIFLLFLIHSMKKVGKGRFPIQNMKSSFFLNIKELSIILH